MWIGNLTVLLIIAGCVAYQYLKGTFVKSFATIIIAVCAGIVAFGHFELLANVFVGRSDNSRFPALVPWAQPLSFALLFILCFAVLQTIAAQLMRKPVDLGLVPERIGRVVCGFLLGLITSGLLLTALAMAPLPNEYPYPRFDAKNPDAGRPNKVLFNTDGFITGWFSTASKGCFSGRTSFAAVHPDFLDQVFLNRQSASDGISITTGSNAIELPRKQGSEKAAAAWQAPGNLKDSNGDAVAQRSGHVLTIVRVGIKKSALKDAGKFTLSQLRLICKQRGYAKDSLSGSGQNVYPVGYLKEQNVLQIKRLNDQIEVKRTDFDAKETARYIDFAFYVPSDCVPVLVEFKQNSITGVPPMVGGEEIPPPVPFNPLSDRKEDAKP